MRKKSKRYQSIAVVEEKAKDLEEAITKIKEESGAKFDESIDLSISLNLLKKHTVRDTVTFPNPFGKSRKVLAFVKEDKVAEVKEAGADYAGGMEFVEKINKGWLDFDVAIATPNMMRDIARVARTLGSKGLMPNPKTKTVTEDPVGAIKEIKAGRKEFRADQDGNLNFSIGKKSMDLDKLIENGKEFLAQVKRKKPADLKGDYVKLAFISSTMGRSVPLDKKII